MHRLVRHAAATRVNSENSRVTGHINALFPWADSKLQPKADGLAWDGVEETKFSFPDGVSSTPLLWTYLGQAVPMKRGRDLCARVLARMAARWHQRCVSRLQLTRRCPHLRQAKLREMLDPMYRVNCMQFNLVFFAPLLLSSFLAIDWCAHDHFNFRNISRICPKINS